MRKREEKKVVGGPGHIGEFAELCPVTRGLTSGPRVFPDITCLLGAQAHNH